MNASSTSKVKAPPTHVVIVEDNVEANKLIRDWLKVKFTVTCFFDAESALRVLPPSGEPIVFVIDYNMPGDNGMTLKKKLAPRFPQARYILISGLFDEKLTNEARTTGFHGILPKPFGMPTVTEKIEEILGMKAKESLADKVRRKTGRLSFFVA